MLLSFIKQMYLASRQGVLTANIKKHDLYQCVLPVKKTPSPVFVMMVSKSFGYAVRAALYLILLPEKGSNSMAGEIAAELGVPRHFMAKVLKLMAGNGIISSTKGPNGGFSKNIHTAGYKLLDLYRLTDGTAGFKECVLHFKKCNASAPCPLHRNFEVLRNDFIQLLSGTTLNDLLKDKRQQVMNSIRAYSGT